MRGPCSFAALPHWARRCCPAPAATGAAEASPATCWEKLRKMRLPSACCIGTAILELTKAAAADCASVFRAAAHSSNGGVRLRRLPPCAPKLRPLASDAMSCAPSTASCALAAPPCAQLGLLFPVCCSSLLAVNWIAGRGPGLML